jgi:hypothetical protein
MNGIANREKIVCLGVTIQQWQCLPIYWPSMISTDNVRCALLGCKIFTWKTVPRMSEESTNRVLVLSSCTTMSLVRHFKIKKNSSSYNCAKKDIVILTFRLFSNCHLLLKF